MKIGLIDVDSHNYPNLALMKISAYHKRKYSSGERRGQRADCDADKRIT